MDDLRWVLLLVGAVVVVAIYLSGRFEREDWTREREQFRAGNKNMRKKKPAITEMLSSVVPNVAPNVAPKIKKEPSMGGAVDQPVNPPIDIPSFSEPVAETVIEADERVEASAPQYNEVEHPPEPLRQETDEKVAAVDVAEPISLSADDEKSARESRVFKAPAAQVMESASVASEEDNQLDEPEPEPEPEKEKETTEFSEKHVSTDRLYTGEQDIEDDITEVEIPIELAVAEAEIQAKSATQDKNFARVELPLDIEPLVLAVTVMAEDGESFTGVEVREALESEGLLYGAMKIFHFFNKDVGEVTETDEAVFSAASVLEPGIFDLDALDEMVVPGLMLFCQLPGPLSGEAALDIMLDKGRGLAVRLHGHMCDDRRNRFTSQAKTSYKDRIETFNRELVLARRKKPRQ